MLERVASEGGDVALVGLGRGLLGAESGAGGAAAVADAQTPAADRSLLLYVFLNSSSVGEVIDKEQRLNRFFHARHRVRVRELTGSTLELEHHSLSGRPPVRAESLFVFGIHLVMLAEVGCRELVASLPASAAPTRSVAADRPLPAGDASRWRFEWSEFVPRRVPMPGFDEVLEARAEDRDLSTPSTVADRVRSVVGSDLGRRWTLAEVARSLALSGRSLQRSLAAEQTGFRDLLVRTRVEKAERLVRQSRLSMTEIAYACGFSDSAHFSRSFRAVLGATPTALRRGESSRTSAPTLETARLRLRPIRDDDLDALAAMLADPEVMKHSVGGVYDRERTAGFIAWCAALYHERGFGPLAMVDKETGGFVGFCGLTPEVIDGAGGGEAEEIGLGYRIRRDAWGRGLATEAATAVVRYAFDTLGVSSLCAIVDRDHPASAAVARKVGFVAAEETEFSGRPVRILRLERPR